MCKVVLELKFLKKLGIGHSGDMDVCTFCAQGVSLRVSCSLAVVLRSSKT